MLGGSSGRVDAQERRGRGRTAARGERGFTLIELAFAITLIVVGLFGFIRVIVFSIQVDTASKERTRASNAAQEEMEQVLNAPYADIPAFDEQTFVVQGLRKEDGTDAGHINVEPNTAGQTMYEILVTVAWRGTFGDDQIEVPALVTEQ